MAALIPPSSPHYDEIHRFLVEIEGFRRTQPTEPGVADHQPPPIDDLAESYRRMMERLAERELELIAARAELQAARAGADSDRRLLEAVIDTAGDAVICIDAENRIMLFNNEAERIFQYTAAEVLGQPLSLLLPPGTRSGHPRHIAEFAASASPRKLMGARSQISGQRKDGSLFPAEASISRCDIEGNPLMTAVLRDISERKRVETLLVEAKDAAEQANRAKSAFLAAMSHELRTPLNAIIGFSDIIIGQAFGPIGHARYADYVADIAIAGRQLLTQLNDILDLACIEAGKLILVEEPVELARIVKACESLIQFRARERSITINFELPQAMPTLMADGPRLKLAITNLLTNAVKFSETGATVTVVVSETETGGIAFAVSDSGIGIKPEDLDRVLQPFIQSDGSLQRRHEGMGLGLPLAKALIELHGGRLTLESTLGQGTTARIILPPERVYR